MNNKERVDKLEEKGFDWLEIADLLNISYERVREIAELPSLEEFKCRTCECCGRGTDEGFLLEDVGEVYCSEPCLFTIMTEEEYKEMYEKDFAFWTEWYKEDEYEMMLEEY